MAGFKNLEDLVGDLGEGLRKLRAGALEPEELTPLVDDARELSDRLILLRFKAHEFSYEVRRKAPDGGVDAAAADRQPVRPFRIGAAYQTSLIDAIEEVSREQAEQAEKARMEAGTPELFDAPVEPEVAPIPAPMPEPEPEMEVMPEPADEEEAPLPSPVLEPEPQEAIHEEPVSQKPVIEEPEPQEPVIEESEDADAVEEAGPSIAEQMERQPISDLRTAFSLVEKYECIKMLFDDDAVEFNRVLDALEEAGTFELALHWLGQQVEAFQSWDKEDPVVLRFLDRVERRYH